VRRAGIFVAAMAAMAVSFAAHASMVQRMEVEDLARAAQVVAIARVESVQAAWEGDLGTIRTHTVLSLETAIAGAPPARMHVSVLGGTLDGIDARYPAGATFVAGERVVVFLEPRRGGAAEWLVTGAFQGVFALEREAETGLDIAVRANEREGVALVGRAGSGDVDEPTLRLYTDELVARVRAVRGAR